MPSPLYATVAWVSKQFSDRTDVTYINQQPHLRFNTRQFTHLSTKLLPTLTTWCVVFNDGARHWRVTAWRAATSTSSVESTVTFECGMSDKQHLVPTCATKSKAFPACILVEKCDAEGRASRINYHLMSYRMDCPQPCIEKNHAYPTIG